MVANAPVYSNSTDNLELCMLYVSEAMVYDSYVSIIILIFSHCKGSEVMEEVKSKVRSILPSILPSLLKEVREHLLNEVE